MLLTDILREDEIAFIFGLYVKQRRIIRFFMCSPLVEKVEPSFSLKTKDAS